MISIQIHTKFNRIPIIQASIRPIVSQVIRKTAHDVEADIKTEMRGPKSGRMYRGHQASAPGEAPAVDMGQLINSIQVQEVTDLTSTVGTNVGYACIYGAQTSVPTDKGLRTIGQIKVGDRVLTATGEWREVLRATRFPVTEKPELVTLRVPWRTGKTHSLTVTTDHKVAVLREGRVLWVSAGDLLPTDSMFRRRKIAHNIKTWRCVRCGVSTEHRISGHRRYCEACGKEARRLSHTGSKRSSEARVKMSVKAQGRPVNWLAAMARGRGTKIEKQVAEWLDERGVKYERSVVFGRYYVDFWLPDHNEIIEADGAYWHRSQEKDIKRDGTLRALMPDVRITHLHFYHSRFTPILDPNPLPNVRYEIVNPSAQSFVEPDVFEAVPIEIERWTWSRLASERRGRCDRIPSLFDLTIEGVHSFVAAGVLVSNSSLEFGSRRVAARPVWRPVIEKWRQPFITAITHVLRQLR